MSKNNFVVTVAMSAFGALGMALAGTAVAQATMKISISIAQNSHQGVGIDTFAKEVERRTAENGFRHMTNSKRAINGPDDLKGLKMRTMENPVHIQAYKGFGINPTPMAFTEVFMALQQGTVDGQENPLSVITAAKFEQVQKHLSLTGHVYSPAVILMNKGKFDELTPADKQHFIDAAKEAAKANRARVDQDEKTAVADLCAKGMQVIDVVDRSKYQAALTPVYAEFAKQFGQANLDRIKAAK